MKNKITTIFTTAFITLLLGSQAAMASDNIPSTYELLLSNGQTAEVLVVKKIKFVDQKTGEVAVEDSIFNLGDGA